MSSPINIKVLKDYAEVTYSHASKKQTKVISLSDIPALFDTKVSFDSGPLPLFGSVNAFGIQRIIQKDSQYTVMVQALNPYVNQLQESLASETTIKDKFKKMDIPLKKKLDSVVEEKMIDEDDDYMAYCYKDIYYPNLLMTLHLKEQKDGKLQVVRSGILGFSDPFITDTTQLYDLPFANTSSKDMIGAICWGDMRLPHLDGLAGTIGLIHMFLGGVMNNDLFGQVPGKNNTRFDNAPDVLGFLALRSESISHFPYDEILMVKNTRYSDLVAYTQQNFR